MTETQNTRHDPMDDLNLPLGASRTLVTGEAPGRSLSELVDDYGAAMARAAMRMLTFGVAVAAPYAEKADALKTEILQRFGGER